MNRNRYEATNIQVSTDYSQRKAGLHIYESVPTEHALMPNSPQYSYRGENLLLDQAWDAFNKAEIALCKIALPEVIEKALDVDYDEAVELAAATTYDRKLGCSCGCSPGFILKDPRGNHRTVSATLVSIQAGFNVKPIVIEYEGE